MQFIEKSRPSPELRLFHAVEHYGRIRRRAWWVVRALGALSLLAVGAVHLEQYVTLYSTIPTIGTLFLLNFAGATAIGLGLLAPLELWLARGGAAVVALLALAGAGLAVVAFVFLQIGERTPLFGFMEPGYDPAAIDVSQATEVATAALLGSFGVSRLTKRARRGRW